MTDEMKKVEIVAWLFNNLSLENLQIIRQMAKAIIERPEPVLERNRPPLND